MLTKLEEKIKLINSNENIFISIACYRDSELIPTILSAYHNANKPNNLYFGICLQYKATEDTFDFDSLPNDINIKIKKVKWYKARGPMYARYLINQYLLKDEKYYLQIDSHTKFIKGWDTFHINELATLPLYSVLSTYPPGYHRNKKLIERKNINVLKYKKLLRGVPIFKTIQKQINKPERNLFWAAGYSFSNSIIFKKIPFDKYLKNIFMGEEFLIALRFYTNNINVYTPSKNMVYTLWDRDYRPTFWEIRRKNKLKFNLMAFLSYSRFLKICNFYNPSILQDIISFKLEKYTIGNHQTIQSFLKETGIEKNIHETNYKKQYFKYYFSLNND